MKKPLDEEQPCKILRFQVQCAPMSANTRQLLAFVVFICVWSLLGSAALGMPVHPVAVFIPWLVGFVWGVGYVASGPLDADLLLKRWLQMTVGLVAIGGVISLLFA